MSATRRPVSLRTLVMWYPDWPVRAALGATPDPDQPEDEAVVAVFDRGMVLACSAMARGHGVRRGMRTRDAQSRCPQLRAITYDQSIDARAFEPVLSAIEDVSPGVELMRPGMCAIGVRGPSRYFGGESGVIDAIRSQLTKIGYPGAKFGIADTPFAASQAARLDLVVPAGQVGGFLRSLSVDTLDRPELSDLLKRMGLRTLGDFSSLPSAQVSARFGADGALAHRLASGTEARRLATRTPPPDLELRVELDPPLDRVDTIAFVLRAPADEFVATLSGHDLVATCIRVRIIGEDGDVIERLWRHPRWFTAADLVDRVRWQVQAATNAESGTGVGVRSGGSLQSAVQLVSVTPADVDRIGVHADGLWGDRSPDEKVHRALTRVQSMLGHTAVVTPVRSGGRSPAEHTTLVPWGDALVPRRDPGPPWPGRLPDPAPPTVLTKPVAVQLYDARAQPVTVSDRAVLSGQPDQIAYSASNRAHLDAWAGPWLSDERWWDEASSRQLARLQIATDERAHLIAFAKDTWWIEATYD